jgi:hypothetical protein
MPDNKKQKTKIYTNKKEFNKANQAYTDSLNLYNNYMSAKPYFFDYNDDSRRIRGEKDMYAAAIVNRSGINPTHVQFEDGNRTSYAYFLENPPQEEYMSVFKKPTTKPIYESDEIKRKTVLKPIKPLGIKPMDTSVEAKLANNKQEIIQEPMSKKQTYTASPMLKKMGKSTGREYVDGKWVETKSKGGTVKKYVGGGLDLIGTIPAGTVSNLTKPFVSKMPKTTTTPTTPTDTGSNFKLPSLGGGGNSSASQDMSQDPNAPKRKNIGKTIGGIAGGIAGSFIPIPGVGSMVGGAVGSMIGGAIDNKQYENKLQDYTANKSSQQNAMTSNIAGNFNPNAQTKQFKKGGELIKRADGSYSKRGLWDNIRDNAGSGKAPTKEMLKQEKKIKSNMAHGGVDTSNSMSGPKYAKGGELKPMGNDMYEVKSYKKGTDKVEYRPNVFIDNKEIIRKNPDGSTQILSDDLGYAKVAKSLAKAKGGNISDNQFDQLYMAQEMSKTNRSKSKGMFQFGGSWMKNINKLTNQANNPPNYTPSNYAPTAITESPTGFYTTEDRDSNKEAVGNIANTLVTQPTDRGAIQESIENERSRVGLQTTSPTLSKSPTPSSTPLNATKPLDTKVNPLGYLSSLAGPAYTMAQGLKGPDPVNFDRMNTKYQFADPRGAMAAASRGVTSAYNAAKNATRTTTSSAGEYLANMGSLASKEGIDRAATIAGIKGQYDMANTQGLNQSNLMKDQFNAQVQMNESIARQQEQDAARSAVSSGLSNIGQNTMGYMRDKEDNKTQRRIIDLINSGELEYVEDANGNIQILPKKGRKSSSVEITPSPTGK